MTSRSIRIGNAFMMSGCSCSDIAKLMAVHVAFTAPILFVLERSWAKACAMCACPTRSSTVGRAMQPVSSCISTRSLGSIQAQALRHGPRYVVQVPGLR